LKALFCNGLSVLSASKISLNYQDKVDNAKIRVSSSNRHPFDIKYRRNGFYGGLGFLQGF